MEDHDKHQTTNIPATENCTPEVTTTQLQIIEHQTHKEEFSKCCIMLYFE
jgi:hypothetical protein